MLFLSIRSCARRTAASALHLMVAATIVACGLRGADAFATAPMRLQRAKLAARSRFPARGNLGMRKVQNDMFTEEEREMYQEGINKVLQANKNLHSHFEVVREQEFFRYYAVDLLSSCTYFPTVSTLPPALSPPARFLASTSRRRISGGSASIDLLNHPLELVSPPSLQHGSAVLMFAARHRPRRPWSFIWFSGGDCLLCAPPRLGPVIVAQVEFPCEMERCDVDSAEDVRDDMRERDQNEHDFRLDGWVRWDMPGERETGLSPSSIVSARTPISPKPQTPLPAGLSPGEMQEFSRLLASTWLTSGEHEP
jgi:hypothetical protein